MRSVLVAALLLAVSLPTTTTFFAAASVNGGSECAVCTLAVGIAEQTMQVKNVDGATALATLCGYFPKVLKDVCDIALLGLSGKIAPLMDKGETPDTVCNVMGYCKAQTGVCRLFPAKNPQTAAVRDHIANVEQLRVEHPMHPLRAFNICSILPGVCKVEDHLPFSDADGDAFSTQPTLRGSYWRGKDCNDADPTVHPGAATADATADGNCNGIYGTDPATGATYEDEWCKGTGAIGIAALGDSATAHFRIPPEWLEAATMSSASFSQLETAAENELDWPMLSWSTGHMNASTFSPDISGPMVSIYSQLEELNRCNHRDFQNIGVNGARVDELVQWVNILARGAADKPIIAVFSMVGNDVCNGHQTFATMTTPAEYYQRVLAAVMAADAKLPAGSHVGLIPLVDGRILFDTMADRIHPLGQLNQDITYTTFYDYLNCLEVSPCWGWMNSNATVRNTTWVIAQSLNAQLPKVVADTTGKLKNIQVHYLGNVFDDAIQSYSGPHYELIEPVDGFHPSQLANSLIGQFVFAKLQQVGAIPTTPNPNNAAIVAQFGAQGGY